MSGSKRWYQLETATRVSSTVIVHGTHYNDVIMGAIASQITSLTIVYSIVYSDADQRKHQSSASLALCGEFTVNSPHKWPVTRKCFHLITSYSLKYANSSCFWCYRIRWRNDMGALSAQHWPFVMGIYRSPVNSPHKVIMRNLRDIFYHGNELCWPRPIRSLKLGHVTGQWSLGLFH